MKKTKRWLLIPIALLAVAVTQTHAVAPFKKVSIATTPKSPSATGDALANATTADASQTAVEHADDTKESKHENASTSAHGKNSKLTGIPQIDYIWDPNLPRELRGYNLSSYPFLSTVPPEEDIHFKCDGLHDGFYSSIEYKCQVYHHCVYGIRHDFLCANFTAFDQKTFICHFVSDVDCEGSQKYWSRNDDLYMATTTTSTTTTTTEPPPTQRRRNPVRPLRPLRRPVNRRPIDDYYYEEEEYDDDYYEERLNRKRKQRPRQRKPIVDYEDEEYDEKRSFDDEETRPARRPSSRDRFRDDDELEEEYDNPRRKHDRSKGRTKATAAADRRKSTGRKPGAILSRGSADERRSFSDDRAKDKLRPLADDGADAAPPSDAPHARRSAARNRLGDKRATTSTTPAPLLSSESDDELDDDSLAAAQERGVGDEEAVPPKVRTTAKPLDEFVTPKAGSSVYARPRAPPRIARPVPVTEKKKFQYPVQKTGATTANPLAAHADSDYYEDDEYEEVRRHRGSARRRVTDDAAHKFDEDDAPASRRRTHNGAPAHAGKKVGSRATIRKPVVEKKATAAVPVAGDDDYDNTGSASNERYDTSRGASRRRPHRKYAAARGTDELDFVDDDYEERPLRPAGHRLRPKAGGARKAPKKPLKPVAVDDDDEPTAAEPYEAEPATSRPLRNRANLNRRPIAGGRRNQAAASTSTTTRASPDEDEDDVVAEAAFGDDQDAVDADELSPDVEAPLAVPLAKSGRHSAVRVVKRPFLPSRGGSPYLPRGLQPVGVAHKSMHAAHTTPSTPIDMGSTISGVRLLEHGAPIVRNTVGGTETGRPIEMQYHAHQAPQTQPQQTRISLDELYENDYDVTLNDALNPTLKPLSPHPSSYHQVRNYGGEYASPVSASSQNSFVNNHHNSNNYNNNSNNNYKNNNNNNSNKQSPAIYHNNNSYQHQTSSAYQSVPHQTLSQTHLHSQQSQPQQTSQPPQQQQQQQQHALNNYNSDSYFSSTDIRRRAIIPAPTSDRPSRTDVYNNRGGVGLRIAQHFYDDFEY